MKFEGFADEDEKTIGRYITEKYDGSPKDMAAAIQEQCKENPSLDDANTCIRQFSLVERALKGTQKQAYCVISFKWWVSPNGHRFPGVEGPASTFYTLESAQKAIDEKGTPEFAKKYHLEHKILPHKRAYPMIFADVGELFFFYNDNAFADSFKDKIILYELKGRAPLITITKISAAKPLTELPASVREVVEEHLNLTGLELQLLK